MIENRFRLERQILLGRQAMRKAISNKDKLRPPARTAEGEKQVKTIRGEVPFLETTHLPRKIPTPPSSGSRSPRRSVSPKRDVPPLPADTDTDNACTNEMPLLWKRVHREKLDGTDPLRSPAVRRMWTSGLLEDQDVSTRQFPPAEPDPPSTFALPPQPSPIPATSETPSLLQRIRTRSFPSLSFGRRFSQKPEHVPAELAEGAWSTDSSSEGGASNDTRRQFSHHSALDLPSELNPTYPEDGITDLDADFEPEDGGYPLY